MSSAQYPKPSTNWDESRKLQSTPAGDRSFIPGERSSARNASGRKNFAEHLPKGTIDSGPEGSQPMEVTKLQRSTHKSGTGTSVKADSESETAHVSSRKSADRKTAAQYGGVVKRTVERERQATQSESDKILQSNRATSSASPGGKVNDELDDSHTGRSPQTQVQSLVSAGSHSFPDLDHVHPGEGASSFDVQTDDPMTRQNILAQAASERTEGLVILQRPSTPEHTEIQDMEMASPISEPPSDIDLQPIPEYVLMDRKATLDETRDRTATEVAHAEEINDVSNLRQGPSQADEEDVPNRTRPRRSVKPPRRYGDLIEMPSQEDIEGDVIVVSRKRLSERRIEQGTTENSATSAQDHNSHAGPSRGPSIGRSRKRKLSSNDGSDRSPSFPKRSKNPEDSYSGAKPLADVVTLRVTPTKLRSAISKQRKRRPAAKSCHPVAQEITSPGPAALPTPEHTPGSSRTPTTPELTPVSSESPPRELEAQSPSAELLQLSRKLTAREPISAKARPLGNPEVWAESRQALCETVPYFKSPQSGCYQNSGHVYAFLYDGVGNSREYMDTDVIIARAGGGMQADATGKLLQSKHHSIDDAQVQAVLNDIEHQNPIVVICGNKHSGALCQMPHRYCVLGWYKPVGVWEEKTMGKGKKAWITVKYRLERLQSDKRAWYAPSQEMITEADREIAGGLTKKTCRDCQTAFPQVYLHGWMCLNSACDRFWKLCCGTDAPCGDLAFHPAFLLDRSRWQNEREPFSVRPPIPDSGKVMGDNLTNINTRGVVCPHCGRCNPRRLWRGWSCDNPRCDFSNFPKHVTVKPAMLHQPWDSTGEGPTLSRNRYAKHLGVKVAVDHKLGFKVFTYTFDGIHGKLVHAVSNAKINSAPGGPDDMFDAMQKQDDPEMNLHLERRPFIGTGSSASLKLQTAARGGIIKGSPEGGKTQTRADAGEIEDAVVESMLNGAQGLFGETQQGAEDEADEADEVDGADEAEEATRPRKRPGQPSTTTTTTRTTTTTTAPTEPGDLMTAFSVNYGMPYKFIAGGSSLPFSSAPWPVRACRADLNWASQNLCSASGHSDFNEQLIFAYMEGQKVEYHDDGERGLGARIASLSLGGKAKMMLRMKSKHFVGCSKSGILTRERPVPGSVGGRETYVRRVAAWEEIQALLSCGDQGGYEARRRELAHELGLYGKRMKKAEDLVTLTLNHGDIVLMEGYEIQSYLEHKVVPEGCLRFALTCRTVLPEHLRAEERPSYGVEEDEPWMGSLGRLAEAEGKERGDGNEVMEDESGEAEGGMEWRMA